MDIAKRKVRAVATRKKEEKKAKEAKGGTSSTPKTVTKASKRKPDRSNDHPSKKAAVTPGDISPKGKSPLKPNHGADKGLMTFSGPVIEGSCCLLTYKDYVVREVGSFIKPTNIGLKVQICV